MRARTIIPSLAILVGCMVPLALARAQQQPSAPPQQQSAPAKAPPAQPAAMTEAECEAYIAKAWINSRGFGPDNGAFFRP